MSGDITGKRKNMDNDVAVDAKDFDDTNPKVVVLYKDGLHYYFQCPWVHCVKVPAPEGIGARVEKLAEGYAYNHSFLEVGQLLKEACGLELPKLEFCVKCGGCNEVKLMLARVYVNHEGDHSTYILVPVCSDVRWKRNQCMYSAERLVSSAVRLVPGMVNKASDRLHKFSHGILHCNNSACNEEITLPGVPCRDCLGRMYCKLGCEREDHKFHHGKRCITDDVSSPPLLQESGRAPSLFGNGFKGQMKQLDSIEWPMVHKRVDEQILEHYSAWHKLESIPGVLVKWHTEERRLQLLLKPKLALGYGIMNLEEFVIKRPYVFPNNLNGLTIWDAKEGRLHYFVRDQSDKGTVFTCVQVTEAKVSALGTKLYGDSTGTTFFVHDKNSDGKIGENDK